MKLRLAGQLNPFDPNIRTGSAHFLTMVVLSTKEPKREWLMAAKAEAIVALHVDYSMADLLLKVSNIDRLLGDNEEAQQYYDMFRRADPKSLYTEKFTATP